MVNEDFVSALTVRFHRTFPRALCVSHALKDFTRWKNQQVISIARFLANNALRQPDRELQVKVQSISRLSWRCAIEHFIRVLARKSSF
jgi:hypothetical protein